MGDTFRIVIAEDQKGMRGLVRMLLDQEDDLEVVGDTDSGAGVAKLMKDAEATTLVLDLGLPDLDGEQVLKQLKKADPDVKVVVLSGQASALTAAGLERDGAAAVIEKGTSGWENALIDAIRA